MTTMLIDLIPEDKLVKLVKNDLDRICKMEATIKKLERELSEERRKNARAKAEAVLYKEAYAN